MSTVLQICLFAIAQGAGDSEPDAEVRCGAASLCVAAKLCGMSVSRPQLLALLGKRAGAADVSLAEIKGAAEELGLACEPASFDSSAQVDLRVPLIVSIRQPLATVANHFVVLYGGGRNYVQVLDYPWQPRIYPRAGFDQLWD